ncbi:hypothetical protein PIB30_070441 [Stylosanthes scabra]|uniref:CCHC-type domain-containing protein n=1 Tax=Stylosanthes scabra TaxID=79078 RepID=A0ABU6VLV8_9FABA|nr:hypothetical protein [Stylosanthes scabra]
MLAPRGQNFKYGSPSHQRFQGTCGAYRGGASSAVGRGSGGYGASGCDRCGKIHPNQPCARFPLVCFACGGQGHIASSCPNRGRPGTGRAPAPQGRVYLVTAEEANKTAGRLDTTANTQASAVEFTTNEGGYSLELWWNVDDGEGAER